MVKIFKCSNCKEEKDISHFYKDSHRVLGIRNNICKVCTVERKKQQGEEQKKDLREGSKIYEKIPTLPDIKTLYPEKQYFTTGIFGSTKSGKTTLLNHIAEQLHKDYDLMILFSSNCHIDNYDVFKKNGLCFDKFNEKIINLLHYINKKTKNKFSFLIFLDDEIEAKYSNALKALITTLRNSRFTTFVSLQSHVMLNKISRNNLHRVICLKLNSSEEIVQFIEKVLVASVPVPPGVKGKKDKGEYLFKLYQLFCKDYGSLIVDNLDNKVYKFKVLI